MDGSFQIGEWMVVPTLNSLSSGTTSVRVEPKVMQVLVQLANRPGEVVSKDELLNNVWAGTFVSDHVLMRAICALRRIFAEALSPAP